MLTYGLSKDIADYASANDLLTDAIFKICDGATADGFLKELITASVRQQPTNVKLREFCLRHAPFGLAAVEPSQSTHQVAESLRRITGPQALQDMAKFATDFRNAVDLLPVLSAYKEIHDVLHSTEFIFRRLNKIRVNYEQDASAKIELQELADELDRRALQLDYTILRLQDQPRERGWLVKYRLGLDFLNQASAAINAQALQQAILALQGVLEREPSRINERIADHARRLPLSQMCQALANLREDKSLLSLTTFCTFMREFSPAQPAQARRRVDPRAAGTMIGAWSPQLPLRIVMITACGILFDRHEISAAPPNRASLSPRRVAG